MSIRPLLLLLGIFLLSSPAPPPPPSSAAVESSTCLMVYREGGAPAVIRSPKCARWTLFTSGGRGGASPNCQLATHQGRRMSQEDRAVCALDVRIPFLGKLGVKEVRVGIVAVFDGHNGAEASEMSSQLLLDYFFLHVYFLMDGIYTSASKRSTERLVYKGPADENFEVPNPDEWQGRHGIDSGRLKWILPKIFDDSFHMEILKESLLRAIRDIDATFSREASRKNFKSGSTAAIVLIADGQVLVANVGDSKAIMCSKSFHPRKFSKSTRRRRRTDVSSVVKGNGYFNLATYSEASHFHVKELTSDHHPDRGDERNRVEAAGGFVEEWAGVPRVNGELAVSRAIGDVPFKKYGVISVPEVTDWQYIKNNDSYLIVASDGIFEKVTPQEICDLLWHLNIQANVGTEFISTVTHELADFIVNIAFERGSMDNMAAVVVPLASTGTSRMKYRCDSEGSFHSTTLGSHLVTQTMSDNDAVSSSLISKGYYDRIMTTFNWLLVEGNQKRLGCFYLAEELNENMDYVFQPPKSFLKDEVHEIAQALPEGLGCNHSGRPLNVHNHQDFCWYVGASRDGDKGQCSNPEGFVKFLGLLDSIPYSGTGSSSPESSEYKNPDSRYILKRRFDRGSYGEVWLAFQWNCLNDSDSLNHAFENVTHFSGNLHLSLSKCNRSTHTNSSNGDVGDHNLFILKRIMVERGTAAYLSGLRERYFGELFLNASLSFGRLVTSDPSTDFSTKAQDHSSFLLEMNKSALNEIGYTSLSGNAFISSTRTQRTNYEEGLEHIARYVESFESQSKEIWLVFQNEGLSLSKLMYTAEEIKISNDNEGNEELKNIQILHPSAWWHWLRTTEAGRKEMRNLIRQLLMALKTCHERNITHRDIKPENMIICFEDVETGNCLRGIPSMEQPHHLRMRIIDFGSAIDDFTMKYLYGSGPTRSEQTFEYTPPEALLNSSWFQGPKGVTLKYDMWSVGVVIMELILGSPHVFEISDRTRALLDKHLEGWGENMKELAYKLRSFMEMCILIPGISSQHHQTDGAKVNSGACPASWKCSEESFSHQVKSRDPLKLGFPNVWALRLVRQLLVWHPEDRLSVDEALRHSYFK